MLFMGLFQFVWQRGDTFTLIVIKIPLVYLKSVIWWSGLPVLIFLAVVLLCTESSGSVCGGGGEGFFF